MKPALGLALLALAPAALAGGRLLATGGASSIEGAAGGGILPWAVLSGTGTRDELSLSAHSSQLQTRDYGFSSNGFSCTAYKLAGDLVYGAWPQLSFGVQYKKQRDFAVPSAVGALADHDYDYYLSAARLSLAGALGYNLLVNANLRSTRANQGGLLGFGGDLKRGRSTQAEIALAVSRPSSDNAVLT